MALEMGRADLAVVGGALRRSLVLHGGIQRLVAGDGGGKSCERLQLPLARSCAT